jgi:hypothetical protein
LPRLGGFFISASSFPSLHDRQIAILDRPDWAAWLNPSISAKAILKRLAAGSLGVERVGKHTTSYIHERFVEWLGINLRCHATVLAHA